MSPHALEALPVGRVFCFGPVGPLVKEMRHERSELMGQIDMMELRIQTDVNSFDTG